MPKATVKTPDRLQFELLGIAFIALGIFTGMSLMTGFAHKSFTGAVGGAMVRVMAAVAGGGKYLLPLASLWVGFSMLRNGGKSFPKLKNTGFTLLFLVVVTGLQLRLGLSRWGDNLTAGWDGAGGGISGAGLAVLLRAAFGMPGSYIILSTMTVIALLLITGMSVAGIFAACSHRMAVYLEQVKFLLTNFLFAVAEEESPPVQNPAPIIIDHNEASKSKLKTPALAEKFPVPAPVPPGENRRAERIPKSNWGKGESTPAEHKPAQPALKDMPLQEYVLPPITLLPNPVRLRSTRVNKDISEKVKILEETLDSFGVKGKVTQVSLGPAITRFELQPAPGVKVSKIVNLADDIALSMAAPHVRIEAPIPGKAAVGIEVPNKDISVVHFREVLETQEFREVNSKLTVVLGKDIAGYPAIADLEKMPHLLIAGATGSGKSVCMNALICSLLFRCKPTELKFLMIDPKMVELTVYNGIPHLISPVVTDSKKAATALRWIVTEMENRYEMFAGAGVRDIARYNALIEKDSGNTRSALPLVVVLIDELADLMMVAPADVEDAICRIAQMARAAGIHLVVATQRPSVDVITGIIKANIPSRIAFAVSSQIDSRTILDMGGAEKLLGRGDMLFLPVGASKPVRLQGVFVSDKEVEDMVTFIKNQAKPEYLADISEVELSESNKREEDDELLPDALRLTIETGQASISMLQRRLHVGYTRAARLMDLMEEKGLVGGYEGSKPRAVLASWDDYRRLFGEQLN